MESKPPLARGASQLIPVGPNLAGDATLSLPEKERKARWLCEQLESGHILFFNTTPFELPPEDRQFLLAQRQKNAAYHKNIAYRPSENRLTGLDKASAADVEQMRRILRAYSDQAEQLLTQILSLYAGRWRRDFASFRSVQEQGRKSRVRARNDLPHTDAFPTRPTNGDRILRLFTNVNPSQPRVWITSENFEILAQRFARAVGPPPRKSGPTLGHRLRAGIARAVGIPVVDRSPYDTFMLRFHNFLKENREFQQSCPKHRWEFPPNSTWLVFTDMVSHAVLEGQFALEQTFLVSRAVMVLPEKSPLAILERLWGYPLSNP